MRKPLMSKTQNVCLVLLCILFTLLAIIMVKEILGKRKEQLLPFEDVAIDDEIRETSDFWFLQYCEGMDELVTKFYKNEVETKDFSSKEKLFLVLRGIDEEETLSMDQINERLNQYVSLTLSKDEIMSLVDHQVFLPYFNLSWENDMLKAVRNAKTCSSKRGIASKIVRASKNDLYLNVYVKVSFSKEQLNDEAVEVVDYFKDVENKVFVERFVREDAKNVLWDLFDTYVYQYKLVDDTYQLLKISVVHE